MKTINTTISLNFLNSDISEITNMPQISKLIVYNLLLWEDAEMEIAICCAVAANQLSHTTRQSIKFIHFYYYISKTSRSIILYLMLKVIIVLFLLTFIIHSEQQYTPTSRYREIAQRAKLVRQTLNNRTRDLKLCRQELKQVKESIVSGALSCQGTNKQLQAAKQSIESKQLQLRLLQLSSKEELSKCGEEKLKERKKLQENLRVSIQRSQNYLLGLSDYTYEEERNFKNVREKFDREINRLFQDKRVAQKLNQENKIQIKKLKQQKVVLQVKLGQRSPEQSNVQKLKEDNEVLVSRNKELNSRIDKLEMELAAAKFIIKDHNGAEGITVLIEENRRLKAENAEFKNVIKDIYDFTETQQ